MMSQRAHTTDFPVMTTAQIRTAFLRFFEEKGCRVFASSSLVPDDPSLLLTNAGMNQFKQYYLGTKTLDALGAVSCQKCLRTNDIDEIGLDGRHLSFFEMLGNFSFGGYGKRETCAWALDFILNHLKLPIERLYFTVFTDDDETEEIWREFGIAPDHISRLGESDNFWAAGPTGPCGPCSEIYYDQGEAFSCSNPNCAPGCDCDRFLEFWNLVFTQYDRQEDGTLVDLPHQNVDTGLGLERMSAIMQHKASNYDGDILTSLMDVGKRLMATSREGKRSEAACSDTSLDKSQVSLRIMADHARAVTFMIADGIVPSNEGRGYVLRRLLRRAVFHGRRVGIEGPFLTTYAHEIERLLGDVYPELIDGAARIDGIISAEEDRFSQTLETGRAYLDQELAKLAEGEQLPGDRAFMLHDTYGFPFELTCEIAKASGHTVDVEAFDAHMAEQRSRARAHVEDTAWSGATTVWVALSEEIPPTNFVGYNTDESTGCEVCALVQDGKRITSASAGTDVEIVLDKTPLYAEMGGEIGDRGSLVASGLEVAIGDVKVEGGGLYVHRGHVVQGTLSVACQVDARVDVRTRELIRRNHTATHLLNAALKCVLGEHVSQAGSLVSADGLRFDFTHFEACTPDQLLQVEDIVNGQIFDAKPVITSCMPYETAKASGAVALFEEKYGDVVRVVSIGEDPQPFSRELCGGLHVRNSSELGLFKITAESSVGANVRRIEAVTSQGARTYFDERLAVLEAAAQELKCKDIDVFDRIKALELKVREAERQRKAALVGGSSDMVADVLTHRIELSGYSCIIARLGTQGLAVADLRNVWDAIRDRSAGPCACVLAAETSSDKAVLLAAATDHAVAAGFSASDIIAAIAGEVDGHGGGRPHMAQAGGRNVEKIDAALMRAREILGV